MGSTEKEQNREPLHTTLVLDCFLRWTGVYRISTREDISEFLFRMAYIMDLKGLSSKIQSGNFIASYGFRDSKYRFTTAELAKYIGYRTSESDESFIIRDSFLIAAS